MAKKRYYQSPKDRLAESRGEERALFRKALTAGEKYAGMEPRRRQELEDAGMLNEDHRAPYNIPQEAKYREYPPCGYGVPEIIDDTIRGVDAQIDYDAKKRRDHFRPQKV